MHRFEEGFALWARLRALVPAEDEAWQWQRSDICAAGGHWPGIAEGGAEQQQQQQLRRRATSGRTGGDSVTIGAEGERSGRRRRVAEEEGSAVLAGVGTRLGSNGRWRGRSHRTARPRSFLRPLNQSTVRSTTTSLGTVGNAEAWLARYFALLPRL